MSLRLVSHDLSAAVLTSDFAALRVLGPMMET